VGTALQVAALFTHERSASAVASVIPAYERVKELALSLGL